MNTNAGIVFKMFDEKRSLDTIHVEAQVSFLWLSYASWENLCQYGQNISLFGGFGPTRRDEKKGTCRN